MRWNDFRDVNGIKIRIGDRVECWEYDDHHRYETVLGLSHLIQIFENWDNVQFIRKTDG